MKSRKQNNTLCKFLQVISEETWERIKFTRSVKGLKINEVTITQNILFEFWKFSLQKSSQGLVLYEAIDEKTNGNDLEVFVEIFQGKFLFLPMQAKIISVKNSYNRINHKRRKSKVSQIDSLIKYARKKSGYPLYLFYNYHPNSLISQNIICNISFNAKQYGCSLVSAKYIFRNYAKNQNRKRWKIPSFNKLHPKIAKPWFILGCCKGNCKSGKIFDRFLNYHKIKLYSFNQIKNDKNWRKIGVVENKLFAGDIETDNGFSPKFRVIISEKK